MKKYLVVPVSIAAVGLLSSLPVFASTTLPVNTPEPGTLALLASGIGALAVYRRGRKA